MVPVNQRKDARKQWLLAPGDKICCGNQEYTITGAPIGYGGSSVIYPAALAGSHRRYAIKECMPARFARFRRIGGVICPADAEDEVAREQLRQYRKKLDQERIIGQCVSSGTSRVISIWEALTPTAIHTGGEVHTHVSEGIFSLLDRVDRKGMSFREMLRYISESPDSEAPLKTGGLPRLHTACRMIEQTLLALERVHEAGYLFGDIQDGNIFFTDCRLERQDVGVGSLLDFGSARPLEPDGKTAMIQDTLIFTTEGFTPPEILYENNGLLRLGRQADIYGVGCLLLRCVLPAMVLRMRRQTLDEDDGMDIGCTGEALKTLNRILSIALADVPEDRYPDAPAMLQDIRTLMDMVTPPKHELPRNLSAPAYFVPGSRQREIAAVLSALEQGETVFLHGVGGIGKTETAIQAAKRANSVKGAYLVHYRDSMGHTISLLPFGSGQEETEQNPEDGYRRNLRILREEYRGAVLVIDNFDVEGKTFSQLQQEQAYGDLLGLDLKLIFTTRYPQKRTEWEIKPLEEPDLLKLMAYHLGGRTVPEEALLPLIREVHGHTLLLTLMAKALNRSHRLTPEALLEHLRSGDLSSVACPVDSDQMKGSGREYTQKDIQSHMAALFRLTGLTEPQRKAMCCAVLLPQEGMDTILFSDALGEAGEETLLTLLDMGWLRRADALVTIHPVVREVATHSLSPDPEVYDAFLQRVAEVLHSRRYDTEIYIQSAQCLALGAGLTPEHRPERISYASCAGRLYSELGIYEQELFWYQEALRSFRLQESFQTGDLSRFRGESIPMMVSLADVLCRLGMACFHMGDYQEAVTYLQQGVDLQASLPMGQSEWALGQLAMLCYVQEDYAGAAKHYEAIRALYEKDRYTTPFSMASLNMTLGRIYTRMGQWEKGILLCADAYPVIMAETPEDYQTQVTYFNSLGEFSLRSGDVASAQRILGEAIRIGEEKLPENHSLLATAYHLMNFCHFTLGNPGASLEYAQKALAIRRKALGENHPVLAKTWNTVGKRQLALGNLEEALSALEEAAAGGFQPEWDEISENLLSLMRTAEHRQRVQSLVERCTGLAPSNITLWLKKHSGRRSFWKGLRK